MKVIDFHTHLFPAKISRKVLSKLALSCRSLPFTDGTAEALSASMKKAGVTCSVDLPVMTRADQVEKVNDRMIRERDYLSGLGILAFGGMHPDYGVGTGSPAGVHSQKMMIRAELAKLKEAGIPGIKIHPAYQGKNLDDPSMMRIIDVASDLEMIVVTHAGMDIGIYEHNYADTRMILHVLEEVRPCKFVLAHMGGWAGWLTVEKDLAGAPCWFDTAFSLGDITPYDPANKPDYLRYEGDLAEAEAGKQGPILLHQMSDQDFVRLCRKHGTDHILFATDSPWADQSEYVEKIQGMPFTEEEKAQIFYKNAEQLKAAE
ncbi:MAG: amidohydrolase family protein [Eubacterium sp.]|nr:amidohydrolase family protein [Eubacterium sp.]